MAGHEFFKNVRWRASFLIKNQKWAAKFDNCFNCFKKAGFDKFGEGIDDFEPEDDLPLATFCSISQLLKTYQIDISFEQFLSIDNLIVTENESIDFDINCIETPGDQDDSESDEEPEEPDYDPDQIDSDDKAMTAIMKLKKFALNDYKAFEYIKLLESHLQSCILDKKLKSAWQTKIDDFFKTQ